MSSPGLKDRVVFGDAARVLTFEAPQGRPSADGTYSIFDPRYAPTASPNPLVSAGTAARLAVSTTFTGASGVSQTNKKRCTCTPPAALLVGSFVLLANAFGQGERVEVAAISATYFDVADDLAFDYAIADTIQSAVMSTSVLPTTITNVVGNILNDYAVEWTYVVAGTTYKARTRFDLVREVVDVSIQDSDVLERFPDVMRFKFRSHPGGFSPQRKAAERDVVAVIQSAGLDVSLFRGSEILKFLTVLRFLVIIADNAVHPNGAGGDVFFQRRMDEWQRWEERILGGKISVPYDENQDDVVSQADRRRAAPDFVR